MMLVSTAIAKTKTKSKVKAETKTEAKTKEKKDATPSVVEKIDELIAKDQINIALPMVEAGLAKEPKSLDFLQRKSRILTIQGNKTRKEDDKVKFYEQAKSVGNKAVKLYPKSAKGYLRRAIAKGKLILFKGILESRSLVLELRSDTQKVLSLKETSAYEKALAHYLLGKAHLKLAEKPKALRLPLGLAWASESEGAKHLLAAYNLSPTSVPFTLDYAILLKERGEIEKAKELLTSIEKIVIYDPADPALKVKAKKILAGL